MARWFLTPCTLATLVALSCPAWAEADPAAPPPADSSDTAGAAPVASVTAGTAGIATAPPAAAPTSVGNAEASPGPAATAPMVLSTPAPAPLPQETRRIHQGFYARMSLGTGPMTTLFSEGLLAQSRVTGASSGLDVLLGGTPFPGFVVGGGLFCNALESEDVRGVDAIRGREYDPAIGLCSIGPIVDFFPDAKRGLHVGGMVGVAALGIDAPGFADEDAPTAGGGAIGLWVGHDWWVSREWSLGVAFRYLGVAVESADDDWSGAADSFTLSFTALAQ
ncbi:MAG TPA: hypothetical protein PLU22_16980 [Polyangiaceae bacterium]|nr:hypothetical protein [Polyangiaceae bacterium]